MHLKSKLDENISVLKESFNDCGDFVIRRFPAGANKDIWVAVAYLDMMADAAGVDRNITARLIANAADLKPPGVPDIYGAFKDAGLSTADLSEAEDFDTVTAGLLTGDTVVLIDGFDKAIVASTKGFPNRGVQSAETEVVVQGSKEAFSEVFRINTALIRRRIRDTRLKIKQLKVGSRSATDIALVYLSDVVRPRILHDVERRIKKINIDAVLDSGYIEQLIEDRWLTPFPQAQVSERPDKAAAAILDGRIVILVDNSPFALIVPCTLNVFFQSSEDYYQRFMISSFVRLIRYAAAFLAVALPGLYIATAIYHPSMLPMTLAFKLAGARQSVPVPGVLEIVMMDLAFELLREAGIRLPGAIGSAIGIVGGLIVGQAAVEAGLVSPIVVIIMALTAIAGFAIPHVSLVSAFRLMKYLLVFCSAALGLLGFWCAAFLILAHLSSLKSFGIPYMFPYSSTEFRFSDLKDSIIRLPLFMMKKRPLFANPDNENRTIAQTKKRVR